MTIRHPIKPRMLLLAALSSGFLVSVACSESGVEANLVVRGTVCLSGLEASPFEYTETRNGRPAYANADGNWYMYFYTGEDWTGWGIGSALSYLQLGASTVHAYVKDNAMYPPASGWREWCFFEWVDSPLAIKEEDDSDFDDLGMANTSAPMIECGPGFESGWIGATQACPACAAGKAKNTSGTYPCRDCLAGTFAAVTGMRLCEPCATGKFSALNGSSSCTDCAAGTYSNTTGANSVDACKACPADSTSPQASILRNACTCNAGFSGDDGQVA